MAEAARRKSPRFDSIPSRRSLGYDFAFAYKNRFSDEAAKALELFNTANVAACAAATGALQLTEGKTKAGIVWPEELDAARFIALSNTLGLTLNLSVS